MAKYYGAIGFAISEETKPDVWTAEITERRYSGDVLRNRRQWQEGQQLNSNLKVGHRISIVADQFAVSNLHNIRYVTWMGTKWGVTSVEYERPRLVLDIGDVYNGGEDNG